MTPLAVEIFGILEAEADHAPLTPESLSRVLFCVGFDGGTVTVEQVESALAELMAAGQVERVHSMRVAPRYRVMAQRAAVTVAAGNRT